LSTETFQQLHSSKPAVKPVQGSKINNHPGVVNRYISWLFFFVVVVVCCLHYQLLAKLNPSPIFTAAGFLLHGGTVRLLYFTNKKN